MENIKRLEKKGRVVKWGNIKIVKDIKGHEPLSEEVFNRIDREAKDLEKKLEESLLYK